jgi:hypothetical protein
LELRVDNPDSDFYKIDKNILLFNKYENSSPNEEVRLGNDPYLTTPSDLIRSTDISYQIPFPWTRTTDESKVSFPTCLLGGNNKLTLKATFNFNIAKLVRCFEVLNGEIGDEVHYDTAIQLPDNMPISMNCPELYIFYQVRTPFERQVKGSHVPKSIDQKNTSVYHYPIENYSEIFTSGNPIESGKDINIENINVQDATELVWAVRNVTLSLKHGFNIYCSYTNFKEQVSYPSSGVTWTGPSHGSCIIKESSLKNKPKDKNDSMFYPSFDCLPGNVTSSIFGLNFKGKEFCSSSGFHVFAQDISPLKISKSQSPFNLNNASLHIKTLVSKSEDGGQPDLIEGVCFARKITVASFEKKWETNEGRMQSRCGLSWKSPSSME